ncbi:MAG: restriction endonuclease subunit S [Planctomycetes bacterium]|nr:restriction endonuclease subunit S [Planctomycetota bacterium]
MAAELPTTLLGDLLSEDRGISVGVMYPGDHDPLGVPLIKAGDLVGGRIQPALDFRISPEVHHQYQRTELVGGELLMTLVGDVGRCAVVPPSMKGWNAARAIAVMRFKEPADAAFVRLCLQSPQVRHLMDVWSNTTVQQTLNLKEIRVLPLPWPSAGERAGIAHILGTLDDKIELNRRTNETLEAMARALFKSWFVDFDPVRGKAAGKQPAGMDAETAALFPSAFVESEIGEIPQGWRVRALDAIADFRNGLALQKFRPTSGEPSLPVVKIADLKAGRANQEERARANIDAGCVLEDGDIVFSWSGSLTVVVWCGGRAALNQHLFRVTPRELPKSLLLRWLHHHLPEFQRIAADKATTMGHIQRHHLSAAACVEACSAVVERADAALTPLLHKQVSLELESRTLAATRDALLPRLLSGELRIPDAERIVGAAT